MAQHQITDVYRSRITYYTLRDTSDKLALPQPHTNYMKKSFYSGAALWNSLPIEARRAHTLFQFKTYCMRQLFSTILNFLIVYTLHTSRHS